MRKRPQLHVGLAWWAPEEDGTGKIKMFDGQHKAAAQILIGSRKLPVRVFVEPDLNVLLQANTNAADKLRQVAFDTAVMRHLGSTLYAERVKQLSIIIINPGLESSPGQIMMMDSEQTTKSSRYGADRPETNQVRGARMNK